MCEFDLGLMHSHNQFCAGFRADKCLQLPEKQCPGDCSVGGEMRSTRAKLTHAETTDSFKKWAQNCFPIIDPYYGLSNDLSWYLVIFETKILWCFWFQTHCHGTVHTQWSHWFCDGVDCIWEWNLTHSPPFNYVTLGCFGNNQNTHKKKDCRIFFCN